MGQSPPSLQTGNRDLEKLNNRETSGRRILESSGKISLTQPDLVSGWGKEVIKTPCCKEGSAFGAESIRADRTLT